MDHVNTNRPRTGMHLRALRVGVAREGTEAAESLREMQASLLERAETDTEKEGELTVDELPQITIRTTDGDGTILATPIVAEGGLALTPWYIGGRKFDESSFVVTHVPSGKRIFPRALRREAALSWFWMLLAEPVDWGRVTVDDKAVQGRLAELWDSTEFPMQSAVVELRTKMNGLLTGFEVADFQDEEDIRHLEDLASSVAEGLEGLLAHPNENESELLNQWSRERWDDSSDIEDSKRQGGRPFEHPTD